jgi:hypothetical protein
MAVRLVILTWADIRSQLSSDLGVHGGGIEEVAAVGEFNLPVLRCPPSRISEQGFRVRTDGPRAPTLVAMLSGPRWQRLRIPVSVPKAWLVFRWELMRSLCFQAALHGVEEVGRSDTRAEQTGQDSLGD